jgi:hypothetical protein
MRRSLASSSPGPGGRERGPGAAAQPALSGAGQSALTGELNRLALAATELTAYPPHRCGARTSCPQGRRPRARRTLRGSSEFHAWVTQICCSVAWGSNCSFEHRAAPGRDWFPVLLKDHPPAVALEVMEQQPDFAPVAQPSCRNASNGSSPLRAHPSRKRLSAIWWRMRTSDVGQALTTLIAEGCVIKSAAGTQPGPVSRSL